MPHLALPSLTAALRAAGHEVNPCDLNLAFMERVLTREVLERTMHQLRRRQGRSARGLAPPPELVDWALTRGPELARDVEAAVAVIRGPAFYDAAASRPAMQTITQALQLYSVPFYPSSVDLSALNSAIPEDESARLLAGVRDPARNPYYRLFEQDLVPALAAWRPDLVGISVPTMGQFLASLTVSYLLRQRGIRAHITLGGPHVTMLRDALLRVPAIFDLVDSAVVSAGERPLVALAGALGSGTPLNSVPNLVFRQGHTVAVTRVEPAVPLEALPMPDFDGLPLDRYLAPEPVLPLLTARGCYYGKCAFCNVGYGLEEPWQEARADRVVAQMLALQERYGTRHVFFADEAISPRNLRGIANALAERGAPLHWVTCARMERSLDRDHLAALARGGCRMLLYGLETASPRIAAAMRKGTTVPEMSRILREGAAEGIWNHVFFFFGFPGETMEDAQATVNFLYAHGDSIHSAALGTFLLERYAAAHLHPQEYGISRVVEEGARDLAIYYDYQVHDGIDDALAETIVQRLMDALPTKENPQFYMHDTYRFLYASHLHDIGERYPPWLGG